MSRVRLLTALMLCTLGCDEIRAPYVNVSIRDPYRFAETATVIRVGVDREEMDDLPRKGDDYPLNITVHTETTELPAARTLLFEARDGSGVIAFGTADVVFESGVTRAYDVELYADCAHPPSPDIVSTAEGRDGFGAPRCNKVNELPRAYCLDGACLVAGECGDPFLERDEVCEPSLDPLCTSQCVFNICGDGEALGNEACDGGDGCRADCELVEWDASVVAGFGGNLQAPLEQPLRYPVGLAVDNTGALYVADRGTGIVYRLDEAADGSTKTLARVAGGGTQAAPGVLATDFALGPATDVAVDGFGDLFISVTDAHCVYRVDVRTGVIDVYAGLCGEQGYDTSLDTNRTRLPARGTNFDQPGALALDGIGNLYIADYGNKRLRVVFADSQLTETLLGGGEDDYTSDDGTVPVEGEIIEEEQAGVSFKLEGPVGIVASPDGARIFVLDELSNGPTIDINVIELTMPLLDATPIFHDAASVYALPIAPAGSSCGVPSECDPIPTPAAGTIKGMAFGELQEPGGGAVKTVLYFAQPFSSRVMAVDIPETPGDPLPPSLPLAGTGAPGLGLDDLPALASAIENPHDLAVGPDGTIYLADAGNRLIRRVESSGDRTMSFHVGSGDSHRIDEGRLATAVDFDASGAAVKLLAEDDGYLIPATDDNIVWHVNRLGERFATRAVGTRGLCSDQLCGDGLHVNVVPVPRPVGVVRASTGELYVAQESGRIRRIDNGNTVTTVAFTPPPDHRVTGFDIDGSDVLYIRMQEVVYRVAYTGVGTADVTLLAGQLNNPCSYWRDSAGDRCGSNGFDPLNLDPIPFGVDVQLASQGTLGVIETADGFSFALVLGETEINLLRVQLLTGDCHTLGPAACWLFDFLGDGTVCEAPNCDTAPQTTPHSIDFFEPYLLLGEPGQIRVMVHSDPSTVIMLAGTGEIGTNGDGGFALAPSARMSIPSTLDIETHPDQNMSVVFHDQGERTLVRRLYFEDLVEDPPLEFSIETVAGLVGAEGNGFLEGSRLLQPRYVQEFDGDWLITDPPAEQVRWLSETGMLTGTQLNPGFLVSAIGYWQGLRESNMDAALHRHFRDAGGMARRGSEIYFGARGALHRVQTDVEPWTIFDVSLADPSDTVTGYVDGPIDAATFMAPGAMAYDAAADVLYFSEPQAHTVRAYELGPDQVSTVIGTPNIAGIVEPGTPVNIATLAGPSALALGPDGSLYIAEERASRVIRLAAHPDTGRPDPLGVVELVLGTGDESSTGEGAPAMLFPVNAPAGMVIDQDGDLFVTSRDAIRLIDASHAEPRDVATGDDQVLTVYGGGREFPEPYTLCLSGLGFSADQSELLALDDCRGLVIKLERAIARP